MADVAPTSESHDRYGLIAVLAGLLAIVALAVWLARGVDIKDVKDITAILGSITAPVVALVSAYFGITAANSNAASQKDTADKALKSATDAHANLASATLLADSTTPQGQALFERLTPTQS